MPLPGSPFSDSELQNLSNKIISEVFGHSPQDTTNLPGGGPVSTIGSSYFTESPSALSRADYVGLQKSFPGSPINNSPDAPIKLTPEDIRIRFVNLVLRGPVCDLEVHGRDAEYRPVAGYNFTFFNRDYWMNGAPVYDAVSNDLYVNHRAGDPANAFMPNIVSVPRGDVEGYGELPKEGRPSLEISRMNTPKYGGSAFVGEGSDLSPGKSSERISKRTELILGKSSLE